MFSSIVGTLFQASNLLQQFKRHISAAGLPEIKLHEPRHTASSFQVAANVQPRVAMEILGHSDIKTTMEIYSHVGKEWMWEALEMIEKAIGGFKND